MSRIVHETCQTIWEVLQPEVMPTPCMERWKEIAAEFYNRWQFPLCVGAMDGKHVVIQAPANSGSMYYNYKHNYSIVLLAVVDANYNFILVDVGAQGKNADGNVFANSNFGKRLKRHDLDLPLPASLPGSDITLPHAFVADEAFPLDENIMRPYGGCSLSRAQKIFNYRLSRARRIVENAFGIMASRFRVFRRSLLVKPESADVIVLACTVLHNFLRCKTAVNYMDGLALDSEDNSGRILPGLWRAEQVAGLRSWRGNSGRRSHSALQNRELLSQYFVSNDGAIPWQNAMI